MNGYNLGSTQPKTVMMQEGSRTEMQSIFRSRLWMTRTDTDLNQKVKCQFKSLPKWFHPLLETVKKSSNPLTLNSGISRWWKAFEKKKKNHCSKSNNTPRPCNVHRTSALTHLLSVARGSGSLTKDNIKNDLDSCTQRTRSSSLVLVFF